MIILIDVNSNYNVLIKQLLFRNTIPVTSPVCTATGVRNDIFIADQMLVQNYPQVGYNYWY